MAEFLTTRQLRELLKVDRTTIYRMISSGQLPAVRVGNQWRFPREAVMQWINKREMNKASAYSPRAQAIEERIEDIRRLFPMECIQQIQDVIADALGVMVVVTDLEGHSITVPSNAPGLYQAVDQAPSAHKRCMELWVQMAQNPSLGPRFIPSHLGLSCARGLIRVGRNLRAMVIVGGVTSDPWPPSDEELSRIANHLGVPVSMLQEHVDEVYRLSKAEQDRLLTFVQRIADTFSRISAEHEQLVGRLQQIAELAGV